MLENGWMLIGSWLLFSYLSGHVYSKKMTYRLFMKYQTHFEVIANKQKFWFNNGYWQINTMLHHAVIMFLALFMYSVIATIFNLSPHIGWYISYIALFVAIRLRAVNLEKDFQNSCSRIDVLLDVSGYSLNMAQFKTDISKPRSIRKMSRVENNETEIKDPPISRRTT